MEGRRRHECLESMRRGCGGVIATDGAFGGRSVKVILREKEVAV